jgi:hypothetical protein
LGSIFLPNESGVRPCHGDIANYADDPHWRDLILFHEYLHGETGRGCGASHQTDWTALAVKLLENTIEHSNRSKQIRRERPGQQIGHVARVRECAGRWWDWCRSNSTRNAHAWGRIFYGSFLQPGKILLQKAQFAATLRKYWIAEIATAGSGVR